MKIQSARLAGECVLCKGTYRAKDPVSWWWTGYAHEDCVMRVPIAAHQRRASTQIRRTRMGTSAGSPSSRGT